ncbi:MAG: hypothetical protein AB7G12_12610 [Thermoanaerobaculia bacterium]
MNQRTFDDVFQKAFSNEAIRHVMIDLLPIEARLKDALKFLDAHGRENGGVDGSDVWSHPPKGLILQAVGLAPSNKHAWAPLRDGLRRLSCLTFADSRNATHLVVLHWDRVWADVGDLVTTEAIEAKSDALARTPEVRIGGATRPHRGCMHPPLAPPPGGGAHRGAHPPLSAPGQWEGESSNGSLDFGIFNKSKPPKSSSRARTPAPPASFRGGLWGRRVETRELYEPRLLDRLFQRAVERGLFLNSGQARIAFFALAALTRRQKCGNLVGLFTSYVDGSYLENAKPPKLTWQERISADDERWAREALRALDLGTARTPVGEKGPTDEQRAVNAQIAARRQTPYTAADHFDDESERRAKAQAQLAAFAARRSP